MAELTTSQAASLRERFARLLTQPVGLRLFTRPDHGRYVPGLAACETCGPTLVLLEELAGLDERLHLEVIDGMAGDAVPTICVEPEGRDASVRFLGLPRGFEVTSLAETIVSAGRPGHGLAPETLAALGLLGDDVEIQTFVTPT